MKKSMRYIVLCSAIGLISAASCNNNNEPLKNLVTNGNAETPKYDSVPPGWINVQGHWISSEGDSARHDCTFAQNGKYLFFAGNDTLGILQQDVSVSEYATDIDKTQQQFVFSGYVQSLDQGPASDQSQILLFGIDSSKTKITDIFKTDSTRSLNKWLLITDTFSLQPLTRFIRIQLKAIRHVGGDNDGYFDNMILVALPVKNNSKLYLIIAVAVCILVIVFFLVRKNKK